MDAYFVAGDYLQGINMYSYCLNNPVMYVDPSGMASEKEITEWLDGLLIFSVLCEYFGFTNWVPGLFDISGEIIDFDYAIYNEFEIGSFLATTINAANNLIVGTIASKLISTFFSSGKTLGVFTKKIKKIAPKVAGVVTGFSESFLSEIFGSINIFSDVAPGNYVLSSFLFMEEGKNHEYIPHIYYAIKYLGPEPESSFEFMIYKVGFN